MYVCVGPFSPSRWIAFAVTQQLFVPSRAFESEKGKKYKHGARLFVGECFDCDYEITAGVITSSRAKSEIWHNFREKADRSTETRLESYSPNTEEAIFMIFIYVMPLLFSPQIHCMNYLCVWVRGARVRAGMRAEEKRAAQREEEVILINLDFDSTNADLCAHERLRAADPFVSFCHNTSSRILISPNAEKPSQPPKV